MFPWCLLGLCIPCLFHYVLLWWWFGSIIWLTDLKSCMLSDGPAFQSAYIYKCMKVSTKELVISNIFGDIGPDTLVFNSWTTKASTLKLLKPSIFFHLLRFLQISNENTCEVAISQKQSSSPSLSFLSHFAWVHLYPYARCLYIQFNMQITERPKTGNSHKCKDFFG